MARKSTTKLAYKALERHQERIKNITDILILKRDRPDNCFQWVKDKTQEQFIAHAEGFNVAVEDSLHDNNCYYGFFYLKEDCTTHCGIDDPEFAEWRRKYYTK